MNSLLSTSYWRLTGYFNSSAENHRGPKIASALIPYLSLLSPLFFLVEQPNCTSVSWRKFCVLVNGVLLRLDWSISREITYNQRMMMREVSKAINCTTVVCTRNLTIGWKQTVQVSNLDANHNHPIQATTRILD